MNAIAPGFINTPLLQAAFGEARDTVVADAASKLPTGVVTHQLAIEKTLGDKEDKGDKGDS